MAGAYTVGTDSTITIAAGQTANASDTVILTAVDNTTDAPDNRVTVPTIVQNDNGATIPAALMLTITDDEAAPDITLSMSPTTISEVRGVSTVTATLSHLSTAITTITVRPVANTYTVGADSTITIAAGDTTNASDMVLITAVDDTVNTPDIVVPVAVGVINDQGVGNVTGSLTIIDNDGFVDYDLDNGRLHRYNQPRSALCHSQ